MAYEPYEVLRGSWSVAEQVAGYAGKIGWRCIQFRREDGKLSPQAYSDREACAADCDKLNATS